MKEISIIVPTYNEAPNVQPLSEGLARAFQGTDYELVFVDDHSPDGTAGRIRSLPGFGRSVLLVERPAKLGLAGAVVEGAAAASGRLVLVMDADLSHPPEAARALFDANGEADIVVGSRNARGGGVPDWPVHRKLISKGAESLCRVFIGSRTDDPMSGLFLMQRAALLGTRVRVRGYKILMNLLYDNPSLRVSDVSYVFGERHGGRTKLDAGEIANYLADIARLLFR